MGPGRVILQELPWGLDFVWVVLETCTTGGLLVAGALASLVWLRYFGGGGFSGVSRSDMSRFLV